MLAQLRADGRGTAGFTLIELVVVLGILALAAALVAPVLFRSDRVNLDQVAGDIADALRAQRSAAILSNKAVHVPAQAWLPPPGVAIAAPVGGIEFAADGFSSGGRIEIRRGAELRIVLVEPITGRVRRE